VDIENQIREFVTSHYLPDASAGAISDTTPLITSGIIDSIGMLGLVDFIESLYSIEFMPREIDVHALDTVERIASLIRAKQASRKAVVD
jgi:acyl carrier protein